MKPRDETRAWQKTLAEYKGVDPYAPALCRKIHRREVEAAFAKGLPISDRVLRDYPHLKKITDLKELRPGEKITVHVKQFNATNPAVFTSHDRTPLNRAIGYARFHRRGVIEAEFAIWQWELDGGWMIITRR